MSAFRDPIDWEATLPIRPSSPAWCDTVRAFWGTLDPAKAALYAEISGGRDVPEGGADELLVVAGRRGGKSDTIARLAVYEGLHGGHGVALAPGQLGLIAVISPTRDQSQEIVRYVKGLAALKQVRGKVAAETADSVTFKTGIRVQALTADVAAVSGPTIVMAIREEWAKFPGDDAASPDRELENSLRPALAPVEGAPRRRLIGITSAYVKDGLAYETDRDHFGKSGSPVLVVRGSTETFNPNINRKWLERERRRVGDLVFAREYEAVWVDAITEGWFGELLTPCIEAGVEKRPPVPGVRYAIAIDPAFSGDNFAVSVAHAERRDSAPLLVQDYAFAWKPRLHGANAKVSVEDVAAGVAKLRELYGAPCVYVDQHGGEPLRAVFARRGVSLIERPWTASSKAPTYRMIRDAMTDARVRLLDIPEQTKEFHAIRGELLRSGTERIQAGYGHDDRVSAAVMSLAEAQRMMPATFARGAESRSAARSARAAIRSSWDGGLSDAFNPNETAEQHYRRKDREAQGGL